MKRIILCDLDGTLADRSHRIHHILKKPKDWKAFFAECHADKRIEHMIRLLQMLDRTQVEIWITSGRSDECLPATALWLRKHTIPY